MARYVRQALHQGGGLIRRKQRWNLFDCTLMRGPFQMHVAPVDFVAGVASYLLANGRRNVGVRQFANETVAKAVKTKRAESPAFAVFFFPQRRTNPSFGHYAVEAV